MSDQARHAALEKERQRLVKLLHVARRDLRMEDADYRQVLATASNGKHSSSKDMDKPALELALAHMKRCGFKVRTNKPATSNRARPSRPLADYPEAKKIRALWLMLHELGAVKNPSEEALAAYVKRTVKVDDLHWLRGDKVETVIETLKMWAMRFLPGAVKARIDAVRALPLTEEERLRLNGAVGLAFSRHTFDPMASAWYLMDEVRLAVERRAGGVAK